MKDWHSVNKKKESVQEINNILNRFNIDADSITLVLESIGSSVIAKNNELTKIILRPNVSLKEMIEVVPNLE
jgi:tRNA U34 5-carboxymethylaminomethyl modifying enzyme MnmG/GidA